MLDSFIKSGQPSIEHISIHRYYPWILEQRKTNYAMRFSRFIALYGAAVSCAIIDVHTDNLETLSTRLPESASTESPLDQLGRIEEVVGERESLNGSHGFSKSENARTDESPASPSFIFNFHMCCLYDNISAPIANYGPPYACIYWPNSTPCPQNSSSFTKLWNCSYQSVLWMGSVVSTALSTPDHIDIPYRNLTTVGRVVHIALDAKSWIQTLSGNMFPRVTTWALPNWNLLTRFPLHSIHNPRVLVRRSLSSHAPYNL